MDVTTPVPVLHHRKDVTEVAKADNFHDHIDIETMEAPSKHGQQPTTALVLRSEQAVDFIREPERDLKHRLRVICGDEDIDTIDTVQTAFTLSSCDQGTSKFTYFYQILHPSGPIDLVWSSCHGECHQPSMHFPRGHANISTRTHSHPRHPKFQEVLAELMAVDGTLLVHLVFCYGLREVIPQNGQDSAIMQDICFSVLTLSTVPTPDTIFFGDTDYYTLLCLETRCLLQQMARHRKPLRLLNGGGVFTYASDDVVRETEAKYAQTGKLLEAWKTLINDGVLGGIRTNLFRAAFSSTLSAGGKTARVYFVDTDSSTDVEWCLFDPASPSQRRELMQWSENPQNRSKDNAWINSLTPKLDFWVGIDAHSEFFREKKYGAMIMDIDYVTLQVLFPDVLKEEVDIIDKHEPGPVVGQINGEDLQCEWRKDAVVGWTKLPSSFALIPEN